MTAATEQVWTLGSLLDWTGKHLASKGIDTARLDGVERRARARVDEAEAFARASPLPDAATASEHLYAWMWDYAQLLTRDPLIQAQNKPISRAALEFLKRNFDVGPETYG